MGIPAGFQIKIERRRAPRSVAVGHDQSRRLARASEFGFLAILAAAAGSMAYYMIVQTVGRPLDEVNKALAR